MRESLLYVLFCRIVLTLDTERAMCHKNVHWMPEIVSPMTWMLWTSTNARLVSVEKRVSSSKCDHVILISCKFSIFYNPQILRQIFGDNLGMLVGTRNHLRLSVGCIIFITLYSSQYSVLGSTHIKKHLKSGGGGGSGLAQIAWSTFFLIWEFLKKGGGV